MRTTLDIADEVLAKAKRKAIEDKSTLTEVIEDALRLHVSPGRRPRKRVMKRWVVVKGRRPPEVDIADRDRLYDVMEMPPSGRG
jgi:hypothetical protein